MNHKYISYQRFRRLFDYNINVDFNTTSQIQEFFDDLIIGGFEIIWYNEIIKNNQLEITVFCGKLEQSL